MGGNEIASDGSSLLSRQFNQSISKLRGRQKILEPALDSDQVRFPTLSPLKKRNLDESADILNWASTRVVTRGEYHTWGRRPTCVRRTGLSAGAGAQVSQSPSPSSVSRPRQPWNCRNVLKCVNIRPSTRHCAMKLPQTKRCISSRSILLNRF